MHITDAQVHIWSSGTPSQDHRAVPVVTAPVGGGLGVQRRFKVVAGKPLPPEMLEENPDDVMAGAPNLRHHIEILRHFGVSPVVAINAFPGDFASEHQAIREIAESGALANR